MVSWTAIVAWFATSKVGRALALAGGALAVVAIAALELFKAGQKSERDKRDRESLEHLRERNRIDADVDKSGPADLDQRMDRWVRSDDGRSL